MPIYSTVNAIPEMISNTSPSGVASASSEYSNNYSWNAFNSNTNKWMVSGTTGWIAYEFSESKKIFRYSIGMDSRTYSPKSWLFEGTNDDLTWVTLDTQTNVSPWSSNNGRDFKYCDISEPQYFKKYRLRVTEGTPNGTSLFLQIFKIEMYELLYYDRFLIQSTNDKYYSIVPEVIATETVIPTMTSNTTPSGRAFASSMFGANYEAWTAFDGNKNYSSGQNTSNSGYIGYEFPAPVIIGGYSFSSGSVTYAPKDWTFEGSNDGINWDVLDTQVNQTWTTSNVEKNYIIAVENIGAFKMYRLNWSASNGGSYITLKLLKMYMTSFPKLLSIPDKSEQNFIDFGLEAPINFTQLGGIKTSESEHLQLGSGKTFEHTIDLSKRRVDKIILN